MERVGDHPHVVSRGGPRFVLGNVCLHCKLVLHEHPNEGLRLVADPARLDVREDSSHFHDGAAVFELHENRTDRGILPFAHASTLRSGPASSWGETRTRNHPTTNGTRQSRIRLPHGLSSSRGRCWPRPEQEDFPHRSAPSRTRPFVTRG